MKRKAISVLLTIAMVLTASPVFFFGAEPVYADDEDYIEIWTVDDLYNVRNNLSANYKLMNDIDMSEAVAEGGKYNYSGHGWEPLGATSQTKFTGTFDGNGHSVTGLSITNRLNYTSDDTNSHGLFWNNSGIIKNLKIGGTISFPEDSAALSRAGLITGVNTGTIRNCTASGSLENVPYAGMISGHNTGTIELCESRGRINGTKLKYEGGICGLSTSGTISKCFNTAEVSGVMSANSGSIAGIVGRVESGGLISNCYNAGSIIGRHYQKSDGSYVVLMTPCGIASGSASLENCYNSAGLMWSYRDRSQSQETMQNGGNGLAQDGSSATNCYYIDINTSGIGQSLNETQMSMQSSFVGFDFENVWILSKATDYKYPQLRDNMQDPYKHVDIIEWKTQPTKIDYYTDEEIDPTGGVFTAYYIDDTHEDIEVTKDMLSGYDMNKLGMQTVTVTFREGTLTYDILTSTRPEVKSMTLESMPDKTEFARGTKFDFTGATAKVEYVNGNTEIIPIKTEETTGGDIERSGTYTITFEKYGKTVTFDVKVVPVKPTGIKISSLPDKTTYIEGQTLDPTGLVVKLVYNSGKVETVNDYTLGEYDSTVGTKDITVTYEDFTTSFQVEFVPKTLTDIMVTTQPTKAKYVVGEPFDNTGMVVKAVYDSGLSEEISDYTVSPMTDATGWQTLQVSYGGKTASIKVYVEARELISIAVSEMPAKTEYIEGETFDPTGMVVLANYNNVLSEEVTDYTVSSPNMNRVGEGTVTILYEGKTATFKINIVEKTLLKLEVTPPEKTEYIRGEELDTASMVVKAVYDNGKSETVTDYTITGFGDSEETNIVNVNYKGKSYAFAVVIHTPEDEWTITKAPTCTEGGTQELYCKDCGKLLKSEELKANGHSWSEWVTVEAPNCTDKGSKKRTCSACELEEFKDVDPNGHTWATEYTIDKAATCTEEGSESHHCTECGVINPESVRVIKKIPHAFGEWKTLTEPTYTEEGVKEHECSTCGFTERETIDKLPPMDINTVTVEGLTTKTYTGKPFAPVVTVKDGATELVKGVDYNISYTNNTNAGAAKVEIVGLVKYTGTKTVTFTIKPKSISKWTFPTITDKVYTGKALTPTVTCKDGSKNLIKGADYTVTYKNNKNVGKATVTIKGKGNYTGTKTLYFKINPKDISGFKYPAIAVKTWNGKAQSPAVTVKDGSKNLIKGADYTVTYKNNKSVGKATVTIKGKGNYSGTKTLTFKINPKGTSLSKVTAAKKGFTVKWKKQGAKMSSSTITGYEVQYSTSSAFKSGKKTVTVKGASKVSKKVTKLKGGKKYYVRVRTYKTVNGVKYYSKWSAKKAVTTKSKR